MIRAAVSSITGQSPSAVPNPTQPRLSFVCLFIVLFNIAITLTKDYKYKDLYL